MPEPEMSSVTVWLGLLKEGDPESAAKLWQRYFEALVKLARKRLRGAARTVADEEVASRLGCSLRTVARKLEIIRRTWLGEEGHLP